MTRKEEISREIDELWDKHKWMWEQEQLKKRRPAAPVIEFPDKLAGAALEAQRLVKEQDRRRLEERHREREEYNKKLMREGEGTKFSWERPAPVAENFHKGGDDE